MAERGRGRPRGPEAVTIRVYAYQREKVNALRRNKETTHDVLNLLLEYYLAKHPKARTRMEAVLKNSGKKKAVKKVVKKGAKKKKVKKS